MTKNMTPQKCARNFQINLILAYFPPINFLFHYYRLSGRTSFCSCIWSLYTQGLHSTHCNCSHDSKYHKYQPANFMTVLQTMTFFDLCAWLSSTWWTCGSVHSWMFSKAERHMSVLEREHHKLSLQNMVTHELQMFISNLNQPQWTDMINILWLIIFIQKM